MKSTILSFVFLFSFSLLVAQPDKVFSKVQLSEDLSVIKKGIFEIHPRPFQWHAREVFEDIFSNIENELKDDMTETDFRTLCAPIFQHLGCGHSRMFDSADFRKKKKKDYKKGVAYFSLPFNVKSFGDKTYISTYLNKDSLLHKGDQLLSIEDRPVAELKNAMMVSLNSDGYNNTHQKRSLDKNFATFYHRIIPNASSFKVKIIDSLGIEKQLTVPGRETSKAEAKRKKIANKLKKKQGSTSKKKSPLRTVMKKNRYRFYQSKKDSSVVILRIPSFSGNTGKRFYKKVFKKIEADPVMKHLVVDVRGNGGGDAGESFFLTRALCNQPFSVRFKQKKEMDKAWIKESSSSMFNHWLSKTTINFVGKKEKQQDSLVFNYFMEPEKKHHYDGPLYFLIDGYSFSASSVLSSYVKAENRAVFIGEETGGGKYGTNAMHSPYYPLPNTKLRVRIGLWAIDQQVPGSVTGQGIYPDYPTHQTYEEYMEEKDVDLEKVYELVSQLRN